MRPGGKRPTAPGRKRWPCLVPILSIVLVFNGIVTLFIYERVVIYHEDQHEGGASTAETYFAKHGGMRSLLREKEAMAKRKTNGNVNTNAMPEIKVAASGDQPREVTSALKEETKSQEIPPYRRPRRRFPRFGTSEYSAVCPWAMATNNSLGSNDPNQNCTFLSRPSPGSNEGVAAWTSQVVMGHLRAEQTSCRYLIDYGRSNSINISAVIEPHLERRQDRFNWEAPAKFDCRMVDHCYENEGGFDNNKVRPPNDPVATDKTGGGKFGDRKMGSTHFDLARVPSYRHAYVPILESDHLNPINYVELSKRLEGFHHDIGFACSLGKLFPSLSMDANQYEPRLHSEILPALQDEESLVLALYIRTGHVDRQAYREEKGLQGDAEDTMRQGASRTNTRQNVDCALALEKEALALEPIPKRIVWMVVSDSNAVKNHINANYGNGTRVQVRPGAQKTPDDGGDKNHGQEKQSIERQVLFTNSKGRHTKPRKNPNTADFADAFLDWYMIGESDFVVSTAGLYSFGLTGGLRTARPIYGAKATNKTCVSEGRGVKCSCDLLYDETGRIHRVLAGDS